MKTRLQYLYSIVVLVGVFVTAYLMLLHDLDRGPELSSSRGVQILNEASAVDPAVVQLLEIEGALNEANQTPARPK